MSELKAYIAPTPDGTGLADYYLKSEADKVIAELELEVARAKLVLRLNKPEALYSNLETMSRMNHKINVVERRERHHKYKRCLARVEACKDKVDTITNGYIVSSVNTQNGVMTTCPPECNPKFSFYKKWHKRWLELAKKFKEAK